MRERGAARVCAGVAGDGESSPSGSWVNPRLALALTPASARHAILLPHTAHLVARLCLFARLLLSSVNFFTVTATFYLNLLSHSSEKCLAPTRCSMNAWWIGALPRGRSGPLGEGGPLAWVSAVALTDRSLVH